MNLAIIGCGLIGRKRAKALDAGDRLVACCDSDEKAAANFAKDFECTWHVNSKELLSKTDYDVAVVSVVNKFAKDIIIENLRAGKHVLAEKPLGRNADESASVMGCLQEVTFGQSLDKYGSHSGRPTLLESPGPQVPESPSPEVSQSPFPILKTGFNHRFHPGIRKAKMLLDSGDIGKLLSIRARYGHGGRPGMEKEWRASEDLCGGGELLDQGVHVIDLSRWFAGDIKKVFGVVRTKFWNMEVEDNAFVYMESKSGVDVQFNVSWTNWRNIFSFEVFGTEGYLRVEGLGGSYGEETLEHGVRKKEGGRPEVHVEKFAGEDQSWREEWAEFVRAISEGRKPIGDGTDGHEANRIIEAIYRSAESGKVISID